MSMRNMQPDRVTLTLSETQSRQARDLAAQIGPHSDHVRALIFLDSVHDEQIHVPLELADLVKHVVAQIAQGRTVQVASMPEELTTTVAAQELGVSRTTLMKLLTTGEIPSHKVGTHARIKTADLLAFKRARLARQRAAFQELAALADELGEQ